jgi:hypothetical protein
MAVDASVGLTRSWDAFDAGEEIAVNTLDKLDAKPKFFLVFPTIHYHKNGGFRKFIDGVYTQLPKDVPLVGCTVAGFMIPQGCYTRGAAALSVSNPNMDIAVSKGSNTKRNPLMAAKQCAYNMRKQLDSSAYKNPYLLALISGGLVPQIPGYGRKKVIRGLTSTLIMNLSDLSLLLLQKGVGREEEVLEELSKQLSDYSIISGSSMDDGKAMLNFQFINDKVETNSIVALGIKTNSEVFFSGVSSLKPNKTFEVTRMSGDKRTILEINNKPAVKEFLSILKWPEDYLDERLLRRTFFYPIGFMQEDSWVADIVGIVLGTSFVVLHKIKDNKMAILSASSNNILNGVSETLRPFGNKAPSFGIISTCDGILEGLGSQTFKIHEKLLDFFGSAPFIALFFGGEAMRQPNSNLKYRNVSFNASIFVK